MKRGTRRRIRVVDVVAVLMTRVAFAGLMAWAFLLYMQNEWGMVKWPW